MALVTSVNTMIKSFADKDTRRIWEGDKIYGMSQYLQEIERRKANEKIKEHTSR